MPVDNTNEKDERIEKIYALLIKYTLKDFSARETISEKGDELDAIIVGLNTLGEELQASGKTIVHFEERIEQLMDIILSYTIMDFSKKAEVSEAGDELDAIAVGLNTLIEELRATQETEKRNSKELEEKAANITKLNAELEYNIQQLEVVN